MSRTIRRKKPFDAYFWVLRDYVFQDGYCRDIRIDPKSKEGRKRLAKYHSDCGDFMGNAPHWYCRFYQKTMRQEGRRQLHLFFNNPEDVVNLFDPNDGGYTVMLESNHRYQATWDWF